MKRAIKAILFPNVIAVVLIVIAAFPVTICALTIPQIPAPIQYTAYVLSAYALTILILNFRKIINAARDLTKSTHIFKALQRNKYTRRFMESLSFRGTVSLYQGLVVNTLFAIFKLVTAFIYQSLWLGAVAAYYFTIGIIRLCLIRGMKKAKTLCDTERIAAEYKSYRLCGFLMFALNVMVTGMAVQMIRDNQHTEYPGVIIFLSAAYTFYIMTLAVINLVKAKTLKSPILAASRALNFTAALMSIFALQTSMIAAFGGEDKEMFRMTANSITGSVVCTVPIFMAVFMIVKSFVKMKKSGNQQKSL